MFFFICLLEKLYDTVICIVVVLLCICIFIILIDFTFGCNIFLIVTPIVGFCNCSDLL